MTNCQSRTQALFCLSVINSDGVQAQNIYITVYSKAVRIVKIDCNQQTKILLTHYNLMNCVRH